MHAHIYNVQKEAKMKFSCIKMKRKKKNIVYVNDGRVMTIVSIQKFNLTMEETLLDRGIF